MTEGQERRSQYFLRSSHELVLEARDSFARKKFDRVLRKAHEAVELYLKSLLLIQGIEPAKSHDLAALATPLGDQVKIAEADLDFLTEQRIPAFYGADDFIPDQEYTEEDAARCLAIIASIGS